MFPTAYSPEAPVAASSAGSSSAQSAAQRMFPSAYSSEAGELPSSFASSSNAQGKTSNAQGKSRAVPRFDNQQSTHGGGGPMTRL